MAFVVKVEGAEAFEIAKECVKSVKMTTDIIGILRDIQC